MACPDPGARVVCPELHEAWKAIDEQRKQITALTVDVAVLKNTRALAWRWGAATGTALAAAVSILHAVWSMLH